MHNRDKKIAHELTGKLFNLFVKSYEEGFHELPLSYQYFAVQKCIDYVQYIDNLSIEMISKTLKPKEEGFTEMVEYMTTIVTEIEEYSPKEASTMAFPIMYLTIVFYFMEFEDIKNTQLLFNKIKAKEVFFKNFIDKFCNKHKDIFKNENFHNQFIVQIQSYLLDKKNKIKANASSDEELLNKNFHSQKMGNEINNDKPKYPAKYYALYHWILIELGKGKSWSRDENNKYPAKAIKLYAKNKYNFKDGQNFYREFKGMDISDPTAIVRSFRDQDLNEKIIDISGNDADVRHYLKKFPKNYPGY